MKNSQGRYFRYSSFLKSRFHSPVRKISVDAGFSCPNREGSFSIQGCIYCNNDAFSPARQVSGQTVQQQVLQAIEHRSRAERPEKYIVYFQPFTNTYAPVKQLEVLYREAFCHPDVVGIAIGTRPDCLDSEKAELIGRLAEKSYVSLEIGVQSIYDDTLRRINRGHDFKAVEQAMALFVGSRVEIGFHLILGFPWEKKETASESGRILAGLNYHSIKIHHLHVCRNTPLEREYLQAKLSLPSMESHVVSVVDFLENTPGSIVVQRLMGDVPKEYLVAPAWSGNKAGVLSAIDAEFAKRNSFQGKHTSCPYGR
ncbi:MAG: TIGR01212 family radical SAM protein [Elusimicrobia bacterium RIFOXYB2_FULL_49_7]|nr:MAG: TIGR01212 family radical SAM protein [Elusimicrobia bacterium RIFOXYB2_FULL_49_7]